jgi:hypothetical protein
VHLRGQSRSRRPAAGPVHGGLEVADGRFSIAIVVAGDGWAEGEFGREPLRRGQTFAWPASLALRVRAGREPVRIVRCLGPRET